MNRYQLEVEEMDRRRAVRVRTASFVGAAVLAVAALWSAGLPPSAWWSRAQALFAKAAHEAPLGQVERSESALTTANDTPQIPIVQDALAGTDSSISAEPQPLYLMATTPGRNKNEGTAQIGTSIENPQTYGGGAMLANGARLTQIHADHVVLTRGDQSARLDLYQRNKPVKLAMSDLLQVGGEPSKEASKETTKFVLTHYIRPNPLFDHETLRGYEVYPGPKSGVFSQLGLQSGDVITALNDIPLSDSEQAMAMFEQLTQGVALVATIDRKGALERISLDGALITADQDSTQNSTAQSAGPAGWPSG